MGDGHGRAPVNTQTFEEGEPEERGSLLDEIIGAPTSSVPAPDAGAEPLVGKCLDARHPSLLGRGRIAWRRPGGGEVQRWLPTLTGVVLREGDRVVLAQPANFDEPIVMGVLDGFTPRPEAEAPRGPSLVLERDELLRVTTAEGRVLLEICPEETGPVVRLASEGLDLDLPGTLRLCADAIELNARRGPVRVTASDDVVIKGEIVELN